MSPFIEMDGQYTVHVRDEPSGLRIAINERQDGAAAAAARASSSAAPLTDRDVAADAAAPPARDPQDDRPDPLACAAPLAAGRAVPPPRRGDADELAIRTARTGGAVAVRAARWTTPARSRGRAWRPRRRIRVGRLTVVLPDGPRRVFGDRASRPPGEIHDPRRGGRRPRCCSAARPAPARPTWTASGRARTCAALLRLAALNREALALSAGWWRVPLQLQRHARPPGATQHAAAGRRAQHRGPLRPRQRLLPAVPRRDDDVLERRLRVARPVARRRPAQQVPAHRRARRPARPASTSSRSAPAGAASRSTRPASSAAA